MKNNVFRWRLLSALLMLASASAISQNKIEAPPPPLLASKMHVEPGEIPEVKKSREEPHHHVGHINKDMTHNDTIDSPANARKSNRASRIVQKKRNDSGMMLITPDETQ